ncbi:MAG: cadherin domain-containing protein, partial [Candidatus Magnetomorum sp.]|nr:cadherin domain-containing protein [Candidatus Magnetomorum sp.]
MKKQHLFEKRPFILKYDTLVSFLFLFLFTFVFSLTPKAHADPLITLSYDTGSNISENASPSATVAYLVSSAGALALTDSQFTVELLFSNNWKLKTSATYNLDYESLASSNYYYTVTVVGDTATESFALSIGNYNEPPVINNQNFTIAEDTPIGDVACTVIATDPENAQLTFSISSGSSDLAITPSTGEMYPTKLLDSNITANYAMTIAVTDGQYTDTAIINLTLSDVNDPPVINNQNFSVNENSSNGTLVDRLTASDPEGNTLTYGIVSGNESGAFAVGSTTGNVTVGNGNLLNYENVHAYTLTVYAQDLEYSSTATLIININNVNEAPVMDSQSYSIIESASNGTVIASVVASDPEADLLTFTITGGNTTNAFALNSSGSLSVYDTTKIDFETKTLWNLTVQVTDGTFVDSAVVSIDILNANDNFPSISNQTFYVSKTSQNGTVVDTVNASDIDNNTLTFSITAGNTNSIFAINASTGEITVNNDTQLLTELLTYNLTVSVFDGLNTRTATISINVTTQNYAPSITSIEWQHTNISTLSIPISFTIVDANGGAISVTAMSSDPSLIANDDSHLIIAGSGQGVEVITSGNVLKGLTITILPVTGQTGTATITIRATDSGALSATQTFDILVDYIPELQNIADDTIDEDATSGPRSFTVIDSDNHPLTITIQSSDTSLADIDDITIVNAQTTALTNTYTLTGTSTPQTLSIIVTPKANMFGSTTISVTINDGYNVDITDTFLLTVNSINDCPVITSISDQNLNEDIGSGNLNFTVTDVETDDGSLVVTAISSNLILVSQSSIVFGGTGSSRTIAFNPTADEHGTLSMTLSVTDGDLTATTAFNITVTNVNDTPTIGVIADQTINEDAVSGPLSFTVADADNEPLTVSVGSSDLTLVPLSAILLSGTGGSRSVTLTPTENGFGTSTITLTVTDAASASSNMSFLLTVTSVNDTPVMSSFSNQTLNENLSITPVTFTITDPDTSDCGMGITITSSNSTLMPRANISIECNSTSYTITGTPETNQNGSATITITAEDADGVTITDSFIITIESVNQAPQLSAIATQTGTRNMTSSISFSLTETDADIVTLTALSSNTTVVPNGNISFSGTGVNTEGSSYTLVTAVDVVYPLYIGITPATNETGSTTLTILATDSLGASYSRTFQYILSIPEPGYALDFDGDDDYVVTGAGIDLANSDFTVEFWANRQALNEDNTVVSQGSDFPLLIGFNSSNKFVFNMGFNNLETSQTYGYSEWHHWAVTYDSTSNVKNIYIDGINMVSASSTQDYTDTGNLYIGKNSSFFDDSACFNNISLNQSISGTLDTSSCLSINRSGSYADFFRFSLNETTTIYISAISSFSRYLYLMAGFGNNGSVTYSSSSSISINLSPGDYTLEITTYSSGLTGNYTLNLEKSGFTASTETAHYFKGILDEVRIWNIARTETDIRNTMTQSLAANETGLLAYYNFNSVSGSTLSDMTANGNHGTLTTAMAYSSWVMSEAPVGNASVYDYSGTSSEDFRVSLSHTSGDTFTAAGNSGIYSGIHLFRIDQQSNSGAPSDWTAIDTDHYWGVYPIGTFATYSITYNYTGNPLITDVNDSRLACRTLNENNWADCSAILDSGAGTLSKTGLSQSLFIAGQSESPMILDIPDQETASQAVSFSVVDSDGDLLTLTAISSDTSIIPNANISIAGSGTNSITLSTTAGVFENLTLTMVQLANTHGRVTITVTAADSSGLASSKDFYVLASPPGPGNTLRFSSSKYVELKGMGNRLANQHELTIECWFKGTNANPIVYIGRDSYTYISFGIDQYSIYRASSNGETIFSGNVSIIQDENWHHLAMTWQKNTTNGFKSYLDGLLIDAVNTPDEDLPDLSNLSLCIGGRVNYGYYINGQLDEFRIWTTARTMEDIRENMCRRMVGNENGLVFYSRFDHPVGTSVLEDLTGNGFSGVMTNFNTSTDWVVSGAAVGDSSAYDYSNGTLATNYTVNLAHADGDRITVTGVSGTIDGLQVYLVNEAAYYTQAPSDWTFIHNNYYWGVFAPGILSEYQIEYKYGGLTGMSSENNLKLAYRETAYDQWSESNDSVIDTGTQTITKTGMNRGEYLPGESNTPTIFEIDTVITDITTATGIIAFTISDADGGTITITAQSSNSSLVTNGNINIAGSGSSTTTMTLTAGVLQQLSIVVMPEFNVHGSTVILVTITDDTGRQTETSFIVDIVPPGSGNALRLEGNEYVYILAHSFNTSYSEMTISFWSYGERPAEYDMTVFYAEDTSGNPLFSIQLPNTSRNIYYSVNNGETITVASTPKEYNGHWNHWTFVKNATTGYIKIYCNGILMGSNYGYFQALNNFAYLKIGCQDKYNFYRYYGKIDEFRIWDHERTQTQIREDMCHKLTGNESGLVLYFPFDQWSGTTVIDASGNENTGTILETYLNSEWVRSNAPLGDASNFDYAGTTASSFSASLTDSANENVTVIGESGLYSGLHVYRVDASPYGIIPPVQWTSIDSDHYWGTYLVGTGTTANIVYRYTGSTAVSVEADTQLAYRTQVENNWSGMSATLNATANSITATGYTSVEFVLGESKTPVIYPIEDPATIKYPVSLTLSDSDGGDLSVTITSGDTTAISNTQININSSGNNMYTFNATAGAFENISIVFTRTYNLPAVVPITVTVEDTSGLSSTYRFNLRIMPGPGFAYYNDSNHDIIVQHDRSLNLGNQSTIETWLYLDTVTTSTRYILYKAGVYEIFYRDTYVYYYNSNNFYFYYRLQPKTWFHMAIVNDGSSLNMYINGALVRTLDNLYNAGESTNDVYVGSNGGSYLYGMLDELRLWDCARSADEIRQYMCQPLTGDEPNLKLYYKFNQTSGTVVTDHSLYKNHGVSRNTDWQISGAALGDVSVYDYMGTTASDFQVSLAHANGDSMTITGDGDGGAYSGLQLYRVDDAPANLTPPDNWALIDTDHYWGVFPVGVDPTYGIAYNYNGISSYGIENDIKLTMRNNAQDNWREASAMLNTSTKTLSKNRHDSASEFVLGQGKTPTIFDIADQTSIKNAVNFSVADSDGGNLTITVSLADSSTLTQVSFSLNSSGTNSVTVISAAGVPENISLTISRLANVMGDLTLTVLVTDAQGLTSSTQFKTAFMPGPGYAFNFSGSYDYVKILHDESFPYKYKTVETWVKFFNSVSYKYLFYKSSDLEIRVESNRISFNNGYTTYYANETLPLNQWIHVACVFDESDMISIYVDGLLKYSVSGYPDSSPGRSELYIGSQNGSYTLDGIMDETRIWNYGRTAEQIRSTMCQKLTGTEEGLVAYYRFDHVNGSTLKDYSIYKNHATMTGIEDASWTVSGAPLGDSSAYDYTGSAAADFAIAITHTMGDSFYATGDNGTYSAIHVYRIDEQPNIITPPANWNFIDPDHYWGVYAVGTYPTFSVSYHYSENTAIVIENDTRIAYRANADDITWEDTVSSINTSSKIVSNSLLENGEFIMGASKAPAIFQISDQKTAHAPISITVSDSDGGMLTITAVSSDASMISSAMINLAGSGNNTLTVNASAGIPQSFTMTFDQVAEIHGKVTITVTITDPQGLTGTQQFIILMSPPGAGNMLQFIDSSDYVLIPDDDSLDLVNNCTFECWYKANTLTGTGQYLFYKSNAYYLQVDYDSLTFYNYYNNFNLNIVLSINTWYHIAVVIDRSNGCRIYINGKEQSYQTASNGGNISTNYLNIGYSSNSIDGYIDEFRIWEIARTQNQIRDNMCKRLNGNETGLSAYYRFDHSTGTTLLDMSANGNNGTLYNMINSQWMPSEAPIGDDSAHDYVGATATDFQAVYAHSDGDRFTATGESGDYTAMHVYMVNISENYFTPPNGWDTMDTSRYYGVFPAALTGTFSASYAYTGNTYANGNTSLKWATRTDNTNDWSRSDVIQDYTNATFELSNQSRSEYILGTGANPPVISGLSDMASAGGDPIEFSVSVSDSATVTITTSSSDSSLISNLNINGTGSDEWIDSFIANVAQDITLTFDQNASEHGKVSVTVIVSSSEGVATTTTFTIILSPPGSGNALVFDGVDDYIDLGNTDELKPTGAFSYELWMYCSDWSSLAGTAFGNTEGSGYALYFNTDTILTSVYATGLGYQYANARKSILTTGWHHFAFTFSGQYLSFYIDGNLTTLTDIGGNYAVSHHVSNSTLLGAEVGAGNTATAAYVPVKIDELRFWNVARTANQIQTNMCQKITGDETGLVAYYRFDSSSGTSLIDLTPYNNDGILNNMDNTNWVTSGAALGDQSTFSYGGGTSDNALDFDGSNDLVNLGDISAFNNLSQMTAEAWVKVDTIAYYRTILSKIEDNWNKFQLSLDNTNYNNILIQINSEGSLGDAKTSTDFVQTGVWYHLAVVFDGSQTADADRLKLYVNGVLQSLTFAGTIPTTTDVNNSYPFLIGAESTSYNFPFDGLIDEVRIWTVTRSQAEIVANMYQALNGNETGLLAYYNFNHSSGTTLTDITGNGYDGTLTYMDDSDWVESNLIPVTFSASLSHADGDQFTATSDGGTYTGIHVYLVNESPNTTTIPIGYTSMDTDHYYGVFPVGITPTFSVAYNYSGNTYAADDANLQIAYRTNNAGTWTGFVSTQYTSTTTVVKTGIAAFSGISATEFILGRNEAPTISTRSINSIGCGGYHSFAIEDNGTVWAWGYNEYGQLGNGATTNQKYPIKLTSITNVSSIVGGKYHTLALKIDGTVWAWGDNEYGQLGDGTNIDKSIPVQISGLSNIIKISATSKNSMALKSDGTVWTWGDNEYGSLGDGTTNDSNIPVQVSSLTNMIDISAAVSHNTALKNDGIVWAWGGNGSGQVGDGTTATRYTPVQVSVISNVIEIMTGTYHSLALKNDATVWAWGQNVFGELGNGTYTSSSSPVQVSTLTNITAISAANHCLALKNDASVWAWGYNNNGQLGDGTTTNSNTPFQVSGLNNISMIGTGNYHTLVLTQDGELWSWGRNVSGSLGDGTFVSKYTPVQVIFNPIAIDEDTPYTIAHIITDPESSTCGLTLSMTSSDPDLFTNTNFSYTCNSDFYAICITPTTNLYGQATVTFIATDAAGLTAADSLPITVTEVNDAPTSTSISSFSLTENTSSSAISFTITDLESNATDLTVTASSSNTSLVDN